MKYYLNVALEDYERGGYQMGFNVTCPAIPTLWCHSSKLSTAIAGMKAGLRAEAMFVRPVPQQVTPWCIDTEVI